MQRQLPGLVFQLVDQRQEAAHRRGGTAGEHLIFHQRPGRLPQGELPLPGRLTYQTQGALANAACGGIDDTLERRLVTPVVDQPQITQRILDFLPVKEAQATIDAIGHSRLDQRLFQQP